MVQNCSAIAVVGGRSVGCMRGGDHKGDHRSECADGVTVTWPNRAGGRSRPPLGVVPRFVWVERRARDLADGISRYLTTQENGQLGAPVEKLQEWAHELDACLSAMRSMEAE